MQVLVALVLTPEGFPVAYEVFDGDTGKNTVFVGNGELYGDPEFNRGIALRYCPVAETVAGILVRRFVLSVATKVFIEFSLALSGPSPFESTTQSPLERLRPLVASSFYCLIIITKPRPTGDLGARCLKDHRLRI